ncbi:MAG: HlyC/CorC family transporter [Alphaproteobacteria bacterium]|nr:HlyC/CorC family transporter [Alphaproteobacteria bacterium]
MAQNNDEPPSTNQPSSIAKNDERARAGNPYKDKNNGKNGFLGRLFTPLKPKNENNLRDVLEEYIEETSSEVSYDPTSIQEKALLSNILKLRDVMVRDVMIPRADIVAIDEETSQEDLLNLLARQQYSRIPVYRHNLDDVLGTIHLKDLLGVLAKGQSINIPELITETLIVSPSMPVLDLILEMRQNRRHMALVVDEHGGIDGLVTINDVVENIVGDIQDEHDMEDEPQMVQREDGSILVDARLDIEEFEEEYGDIFDQEDRDESDTIGGLVCDIAGRVPDRGEILTHENGTVFEILDADPRRVKLIRIRNIPDRSAAE